MTVPHEHTHPGVTDSDGVTGGNGTAAAAAAGNDDGRHAPSSAAPRRHLAIVTCMDARIDVLRGAGVELGDAHIIRNAGGMVTDDVIRSLMVSQRLLGTTDIILMQHTACGMSGLDEKALRDQIRRETGAEPPFEIGSFQDLEASVRAHVELLRKSPFLPHRDRIRGYVYDVATHQVRRVTGMEAQGVGG